MQRIKKNKYFNFAQFLGVTVHTRKREIVWLRYALWIDAKKEQGFSDKKPQGLTNEDIASWSGHDVSSISNGNKTFTEYLKANDKLAIEMLKKLNEKKREFFKKYPDFFEEVEKVV